MTTNVTRCAPASCGRQESPAATASVARTWLLIEQPGPWGAKAFTASNMDPEIGRALERAAKGTGLRPALIRRPGRPDERESTTGHRVFVAHTVPGATWIRTARVTAPGELLDLDFARLAAGAHDGFGTPHSGAPLVTVCTNGKRDRCCAILGRPLAAALVDAGTEQVWETTHLGGHRFSPTTLVLPHGYAYARQTPASARAVLEATAAGHMVVDDCRGRSSWEPAGQAAELAVRRATGETRADALVVDPAAPADPAPGWTVRVTHRDGRAWEVGVEPATGELRQESCGGPLVAPSAMAVRSVSPLVSDRAGAGE